MLLRNGVSVGLMSEIRSDNSSRMPIASCVSKTLVSCGPAAMVVPRLFDELAHQRGDVCLFARLPRPLSLLFVTAGLLVDRARALAGLDGLGGRFLGLVL